MAGTGISFATGIVEETDGGGDLLAANNLSDVASAATSRTNLGLVIGTDVLAPTGSGTSLTGVVLTANNLSDVADAATARTNLGLVIGTDVLAPSGAGTALTGILYLAGGTMTGETTFADQLVTRPVIKDYGETANPIGSIGGGTQDIDLTLGNVATGTVDTSTTTFTFSNPPATGTAGSFTLKLTNGGSQTINWPASVDWAGGTAPTLTAAGVDILTFVSVDGGTIWYGFAAGIAMA